MAGTDIIYRLNEGLVVLVVFALMLIGTEAGVWFGRRRSQVSDKDENVRIIVSAELALLSLLLGFTFSAASSRFDSRRDLVVAEATAIRTSFLRAQALPDAVGMPIKRLLRQYVDARLQFFEAGQDPAMLGRAQRKTEELQDAIWGVAVSAAHRDPKSSLVITELGSLTETFAMSEKRAAALRNRVPAVVLRVLFAVATLSLTAVGYSAGLSHERPHLAQLALSFLVAGVLLVIMDLDCPREGMIRVSQQSLIVVRASMDRHLSER